MTAPEQYQTALRSIPPAGEDLSCHTKLLSVANYGVLAGVPPEQIARDIAAHIPAGKRAVYPREIEDAVRKAAGDVGKVPLSVVKPRPPAFKAKGLRDSIIARGRKLAGCNDAAGIEAAIRARSRPQPVGNHPAADAVLFLDTLFEDTEHLFLGAQSAGRGNVRTAAVWSALLRECAAEGRTTPFPHLVINPLSGQPGRTKTGTESWRCDDCVVKFRYALGEFDGMPLAEQLAFWAGVPLPIAALIFSGGKSVHALIRVDAADRIAWEREVEGELFRGLLQPLGIDAACRNESRLARLPGHMREDKQALQRLIYLQPKPAAGGIFS